MLWLCLYCPDSLLESLLAATPDMAGAAVVSETIRGCERVQSANAQARKQGVQVGMKLAAAYALDDSLVVYPYQASVAQHTQRELACWAMQYTSYVSIGANQTILLEVSGSLTLFGGIEALYQRVAADLETDFGYQCAISVAPTPLGATWLALANKACVVDSIAGLHRALKPLPIKVLRLEPKLEKKLVEEFKKEVTKLTSFGIDTSRWNNKFFEEKE